MSVGDVLAQLVVEKVPLEKYNAKRTVRFGFFGTFFGVSSKCLERVCLLGKGLYLVSIKKLAFI